MAESVAGGRMNVLEMDERIWGLRGMGKMGGRERKRDVDVGWGEGVGGYDEEEVVVEGRKVKRWKALDDESAMEEKSSARASTQHVQTDIRSHFFSPAASVESKAIKGASASTAGLPSLISDLDHHASSSSPTAPSKPQPHPRISNTTSSSELAEIHALIASATHLTPLRRRVLALLTQVPPGHYTTYGALASYVSAHPRPKSSPSSTSKAVNVIAAKGKASPRSIGQAMRNNPFAPRVPCHRVLAVDGKIGGFGGDWGEEGKHAGEKRRLLRAEGVRFDGKGRAMGSPWTCFKD